MAQPNVTITDKKLEIILTTEAVLKDPILCKGYQQFQVINLFLDTLVRKDPSVGIVSGISNRWDISSDQKEYIFYLSEKKHFHNDDNIKAEDVMFSFNRHLEVGSPSIIAGYLRNVIDKIVVLDPLTIKFVLKGAYPPFLELLTMPGFGIVSKKSTSNNIIGSGPYIFRDKQNEKWCLQKIKNYNSSVTNIDEYCFRIERDVNKTTHLLNTKEISLAMGSPLEVALSKDLKNYLVGSPTFSLVSTHIFINHSNPFFKKKSNRELIRNVAYSVRSKDGVLTKFDQKLNSFLPAGIMPESYYEKSSYEARSEIKSIRKKVPLSIVFPYGIFLESTVEAIVDAYKKVGFDVSYINVKGKDLLSPILSGKFDLLFVPYQGVISDPDGYLDLLDPNSIFAKAQIPTKNILKSLGSVRFITNRNERLNKYEKIFHDFEKNSHIIPFSQNSIPIVFNRKIKIPDLNFSFHLNLRELQIINE